jgi:hypothetical protein
MSDVRRRCATARCCLRWDTLMTPAERAAREAVAQWWEKIANQVCPHLSIPNMTPSLAVTAWAPDCPLCMTDVLLAFAAERVREENEAIIVDLEALLDESNARGAGLSVVGHVYEILGLEKAKDVIRARREGRG